MIMSRDENVKKFTVSAIPPSTLLELKYRLKKRNLEEPISFRMADILTRLH